jgi:RNA polymerase sigma-70 factor, ECF subfamily
MLLSALLPAHPSPPSRPPTPVLMSSAPTVNPECQLADRLRRGEPAALVEIYERSSRPLYRYALAMSGSVELSEEALQETFVQLMRRPENFQPERGQLQGFLFGVIRNVLMKLLGKERGDRSSDPLDEGTVGVPDTHATPLLEGLEKAERISAVRAAVVALPAHYREVVVLCDLEELNYDAAAAILDCPVGTIRSRLNRARGLLRERLEMFREGGAK